MGPKKNNNTSKSPKIVKSESESEHSESEEENLFVTESKKKPAANTKKFVEPESDSESEYSDSEESEEENLFVTESKKKPTPASSKKQAPKKPEPTQTKKKASTKKVESDESEHSDSSEEEEEEEQTKVTPAKPATNQAKKKAPAKPAAANPKKNAAKKPEQVSEFILRQREEEAKKEKEKEEKKKREEEAKIKKAEQDKIDEEQAKIRSAERSKKKAEKKEKDEAEAKERSRLEKIAKLTGNSGVSTPTLNDSSSSVNSTGKIIYKNNKKKKPTNNNNLSDSMKDLSIESTTTTTTTTTTSNDNTTETPKETSWDDDDWESIEDKRVQQEEEEKKQAEEEEAKKKADKEAKKNAKNANNKKKNQNTSSTSNGGDKQDEYRSPIICILGHVDTGKTSLLDKIRHTNVQGGEARGITQQIGASFIPVEAIKEQTKTFAEKVKMDFKLPGLLLIDTPGHESFNNLRSRGSGLCDVAILVVDIMHGLEAQTIESINLLRMRQTPFIVALNKVDRIYDWKTCVNSNFVDAYKEQSKQAIQEFDSKVKETVAALAGQELNSELYWRNKDYKKVVSLVPTSAQTGEGISDLMLVVIQLMQKLMLDKVVFQDKLQCTLLEVKVIEGFGCTVDVVLVNGRLNEGDRIIVSGFNGPIDTTIRSILTPPPLRESRVKTQYIPHKSIKAAMGVKIVAPGLEKAVPGTSIYVVEDEDEVDALKSEALREVESVLNEVETSGIGVSIQASTIGSLEAFSSFLKKIKVPVANVAVGPVHKKNIMQAAIMLDKDPKYAILLAFDVKIDPEAQQTAEQMKVKVISEETIYLFEDKLKKHFEEIRQVLREETASKCVWPCILQITEVFRQAKHIIVAAKIKEGTLRIGTPIAVPNVKLDGGIAEIGVVLNMKHNDKDITVAKKDDHVSVEINDDNAKTTFGRHFDDKTNWYSKISRESINSLKEGWADELTQSDANVIKFLKGIFKIQ